MVVMFTGNDKENRSGGKKGRVPKEAAKEDVMEDSRKERRQEDRKRWQKLFEAKVVTEVRYLIDCVCTVSCSNLKMYCEIIFYALTYVVSTHKLNAASICQTEEDTGPFCKQQ